MSHRTLLPAAKPSSRPQRAKGPRRSLGMLGLAAEWLEARRLMAVAINPDAYVALQATPLTVAGGGLLSNDSSTTASALAVTGFTQPTSGTLTVLPGGSFTYTPSAGYIGPDSFTYTAADAQGATGTATVTLTVNATTPVASVFAGPRLANVSSAQGALLNAVLGGLVGTNLNLSVADYNGLAGASLNGGRLADALAAGLGVTPAQALTTNATLGQVFTAAASVAQADGNTAEATAFTNLAAAVGGLTAPIRLGDLIQVDPNNGTLAAASLNALDLVNGTVQLFNFNNVLATPTPITISGAALGLPGVVPSVAISARVVEPPILTTGPNGTQFHSAAVRIRTDLNLNSTLNTAALTAALAGPLTAALGPFAVTTTSATLGQLSVFTEVAPGQGTIAAIDALGTAVTLQATPGVASVYLGAIADSVFFDRARLINPATDVGFGTVGALTVGASVLGVPALNQTTGIQLRSVALGTAPTPTPVTFNAPFPQSQTISTGAAFLTNLVNTLVANLGVQLSGSLGAVLDPLVNTVVLPALRPIVTAGVTPLLTPVLTNVVDPALQTLGTRLGQLDLTVNAVGVVAAPGANADFATTPQGSAVIVPVLNNDASLPGQAITVTAVTQPTRGTVVINADGTITYTPTVGTFGPDSFTYTISDPGGLTSTATVTLNVVPPPPVATPDAYTTPQGTALIVPGPGVLANDTDVNGSPLTAVVVAQPTRGALTLNADGSFVYTPTAGAYGPDTFTYQASNGTNLSAPVTVTLSVAAALPTATPDAYTTTAGGGLTVPASTGVLANDADPNGLPLSAVVVAGPSNGTLTLNPDGSFTYTPTVGFLGADSFSYQAADANGASAPVTVSVTVQAGTPTATPDAYTTTAGVPLSIPASTGVLANDADPNGLPLSAVLDAGPAHGTLTLNPDGSLSYSPMPGYFGPDSFTYRATDATGMSAPVTVSVSVAAGAVVATPDAYTTTAGVPLVAGPGAGVLLNDSTPNGLPLASLVVTGPSNGTLTLNLDGSFTYFPTAGYVGADSFTYVAGDGTGQSLPATVSLAVNAANNGGGGTTSPPQVVTTYPVTGTVNVPITVAPVVAFTDGDGTTPPGSYAATISWGDGTTPSAGTVTVSGGVYQVTGDHTYGQSGTFPVSATITRPGSIGLPATTLAVVSPASIADPSNASLSGVVFRDANGDGVRGAGEAGVFGATIILAGASTSGRPIFYVTPTALDGSYTFAGLPAGTYAIAEMMPNGALRMLVSAAVGGQASAGSLGGVAGDRLIVGINVPAGAVGTGYNFAEAAGPSLSGTVYLDANRNGRNDANEFGIATFLVTLTGVTAAGQGVTLTTTTDAAGNYSFAGLGAGVYQVRVARPSQFFNKGRVAPGTAGGVVRGESIVGISLDGSTSATGYNFGEQIRANCRLDTPAIRAILRVGPAGTLPPNSRPVNLASNGPVARFLPALVAVAGTGASVAAQQVRGARVVHLAATPIPAAQVQVQLGKVRPQGATRRHR